MAPLLLHAFDQWVYLMSSDKEARPINLGALRVRGKYKRSILTIFYFNFPLR
jgi:hypothetical protein